MDADSSGGSTDGGDGRVAIPAPRLDLGGSFCFSLGTGLEETPACAAGTCVHLRIYTYRNRERERDACTCVQTDRERRKRWFMCLYVHTPTHTHRYICIHTHTHICVCAYVFTQLNPVFFSLALFAAVRRGEALVSRGTGGVPCPPQPLHRPK